MTQGGGGASAQAVSRCSPQRLLVGINPEMIMQARNMPLSFFLAEHLGCWVCVLSS
jgi:hypothetical protein